MIQANELRIGNWISVTHFKDILFWKITGNDIAYMTDEKIKHELISLANPAPIPLTPQILEKCGFENKKLNMYILKTDGFELSYDGETTSIYDPDFGNGSGIITNIKHLHQLQNLYFALTNEELKIEL